VLVWLVLSAVFLRRELSLSRLELTTLGALSGLLLWQIASLAWTDAVPPTVLEPQRTLLYLVLLAAALLGLGREQAGALVAGVLAGSAVACVWNLVFRWGSGSTTGEEATPIGYANGLALLAVVAILLAAGLVLTSRPPLRWVAAASALPPAAVLLLAESRAAWIALASGAAALAVLRTSRPGLGLVVVAASGVVASFGAGIAASEERRAYWSAALAEWVDQPLLGSGAGTWSRVWLDRREELFSALDAHSLYVEALSELGPVALLLVASLLVAPLVAASRVSGEPAVPAAAAAFVAFVVHLAADWDWELAAVTAAGLLCGAALLLSARRGGVSVPRAPAVAVGIVAFVATVPLLAGNVFLTGAREALRRGDPAAAMGDARRAARLQPWAAEPWRLRAEAELALGERAVARRSVGRAVDRDPADVEVWRTATRALDGSARREAEERVRELDPLSVEAPRE
jgi:hypothetical protein